jgi:thiamine pyrophosphate-dependent acetolactate synthase large subunit-like protein
MTEAIGMRGIPLEDPGEVADGMAAPLAHNGPVLVDAVVNRAELAIHPRAARRMPPARRDAAADVGGQQGPSREDVPCEAS